LRRIDARAVAIQRGRSRARVIEGSPFRSRIANTDDGWILVALACICTCITGARFRSCREATAAASVQQQGAQAY
jgi:hypothetical protein